MKVIVDENGEIIDTLKDGDKIVRAHVVDTTYQTWKMESFYKGHIAEIRKLMKELTTHERAFLFSIATYVGYEDCCIKYDNGNCLNFDDLVSISGMSRSRASETINTLIKKDILYKGKNSQQRQYFVNPWIFCKGNRINKVLKTMFNNYRIRVLDGRKWKDMRGYQSI